MVRRRDVDPVGDVLVEHIPCSWCSDGSAPRLPVDFGISVARVERYAVSQVYAGVEIGLHLVDGCRDEVCAQQGVGPQVVEEAFGACQVCVTVEEEGADIP